MYRVLIWGAGYGYSQYINLFKYQELLGELEIVGITARDALYDSLDGYLFCSLEQVKSLKIDYIVVTTDTSYFQIMQDGIDLGFKQEQFLRAKIFELPNFRFSKYVILHSSKISIIANNCWGGLISHTLGLEFRTPFVNMFLEDLDYIKMLENLDYYLGFDLKLDRYEMNIALKREYPVCKLDDIELHFNHYTDVKEVEKKWYRRLNKLNRVNLFVMMYTSDVKVAEAFDELPYTNKICFVPFETSLQSAYYMRLTNNENMKDVPFWEIVNKTASGHYHDYDILDLLIYGKIKEIRI